MLSQQQELDPHLFKLAEEAFRAMKTNVVNQEIIITGISGSGKTEAAKLILAYLANACNHFKFLGNIAEGDELLLDGVFEQSLSEESSLSEEEDEESS